MRSGPIGYLASPVRDNRADAARGRRRQHPDPPRRLRGRASWSSTGASRPAPGATGDELAERIAGLFALCGMAFGDIDAVCVSSVVPPLGSQFEQLTERYLEAECLTIGPGRQDRDADPDREPARGRRRPPRQRDRRLRALRRGLRRRRLRHRDQHRRRLRRRRVPRRRDRPRPRDLAQRPDRTRGPDHPDRPRRAARRRSAARPARRSSPASSSASPA